MATATLKCCHCKTRFPQEEAHRMPVGNFCSRQHVIDYAMQSKERASKKAARERRQEDLAEKRAHQNSDVARQKLLTQAAVNKLCLLLDRGKPCISCGAPYTDRPRSRNASHYKSRGANSLLRYDLRNIHASCMRCNMFLSGNLQGYAEGVLERYGEWMLSALDASPQLYSWKAEELIAMRSEINKEIRRIEAGEDPSRNWRGVPHEA